jgi:hypothetical protein
MMARYSLIIALFTSLLCNGVALFAETDSLTAIPKESPKDFSFYIGGNYGSNYLYYGRTFSDNKPYYSTDLTLMHKSGFWASGSVFHLFNETPYINFYDISVGWQKNFNSWLDGGITFSRFVFPGANADNSAAGFSFWTFQAGFDWNFLYTSVNGSFLTGDQIEFYLILKNSRYFQTKKFNKGRMYVSIDPGFTFVAGSRDYYKITQTRRSIGRWPGMVVVEEERSFEMLDFEFSIPLAMNWNNLSFEPSIIYYYPINLSYNDFSKEGFYLYFSLYISI